MEIEIKEERVDDKTISLVNYHIKSGAIFYFKPNNDFSFFCTLCQKTKCENLEKLRNHFESCAMDPSHTFNLNTNSEIVTKSESASREPDSLSNIDLIKEGPNDWNDNNIKCGEVYYSKTSKLVALECTLCITEAFTSTIFDEFLLHSLTHLQPDEFEGENTETETDDKAQSDECSSLKKHYKAQAKKKSFKCAECLKSFITSYNLKIHLRTHTGEKPFKCEECLKCLTSSRSLKMHMRTHTGEKPYKCEDCLKCFASPYSLKHHMRIHTGERPFKCGECLKCFTLSNSLKMHMRIHTGEKPFKCEDCLKSFISSITLRMHMLTHRGETPFKCEDCVKYFTTPSLLKRHMVIHTGEKPFKCKVSKKITKISKIPHTMTHSLSKSSQAFHPPAVAATLAPLRLIQKSTTQTEKPKQVNSQNFGIFTNEEEVELCLLFKGYSYFECQKIAYQLAVERKIKVPESWLEKKEADADWVDYFRDKTPFLETKIAELSVKSPTIGKYLASSSTNTARNLPSTSTAEPYSESSRYYQETIEIDDDEDIIEINDEEEIIDIDEEIMKSDNNKEVAVAVESHSHSNKNNHDNEGTRTRNFEYAHVSSCILKQPSPSAEESFLLSLEPALKKVPEINRTRAKIEILQILEKYSS